MSSAQNEAEQILRDLLKNESDEQQQLVRQMTKGLNSNELADLLQTGLVSGRIEVGQQAPAFLGDDGTATPVEKSTAGGSMALNDDAALIRAAGGTNNNENWK